MREQDILLTKVLHKDKSLLEIVAFDLFLQFLHTAVPYHFSLQYVVSSGDSNLIDFMIKEL